MRCDCQRQQESCWAWLIPADPRHIQPHALCLCKLKCCCSLAHTFHPYSHTWDASVGLVSQASVGPAQSPFLVLSSPGSAVL